MWYCNGKIQSIITLEDHCTNSYLHMCIIFVVYFRILLMHIILTFLFDRVERPYRQFQMFLTGPLPESVLRSGMTIKIKHSYKEQVPVYQMSWGENVIDVRRSDSATKERTFC